MIGSDGAQAGKPVSVKTTPLNRISSRDSQGLGIKRRDRAKGHHQGDKHDIKAGAEKGESLDFDPLHLLSVGLSIWH